MTSQRHRLRPSAPTSERISSAMCGASLNAGMTTVTADSSGCSVVSVTDSITETLLPGRRAAVGDGDDDVGAANARREDGLGAVARLEMRPDVGLERGQPHRERVEHERAI